MTIDELVRHLEVDHGFANVKPDDAEATHQRLHPSEIIVGFNFHVHNRFGAVRPGPPGMFNDDRFEEDEDFDGPSDPDRWPS